MIGKQIGVIVGHMPGYCNEAKEQGHILVRCGKFTRIHERVKGKQFALPLP